MTEEKEMWTIDELVSMTETVQIRDVEWQGKTLKVQWCELVESEEPKMSIPSDSVSEEEQNDYYKKLASDRVLCMIEKGNKKGPDSITLTRDNWGSLPTTLRWNISTIVLGAPNESFQNG